MNPTRRRRRRTNTYGRNNTRGNNHTYGETMKGGYRRRKSRRCRMWY